MCMQDVKLGRAAEARAVVSGSILPAAGLAVGRNNADRKAYVVAVVYGTAPVADGEVIVYGRDLSGPPLALLSRYQPRAYIDVERFGDAALGPLLLHDAQDGGAQAFVSEVVWTQTLENAVALQR